MIPQPATLNPDGHWHRCFVLRKTNGDYMIATELPMITTVPEGFSGDYADAEYMVREDHVVFRLIDEPSALMCVDLKGAKRCK